MQLLLQAVGAILAIIFGVLFFFYLPHDPGDIATDAFFVGAGVLLLNSTYKASRRPVRIPRSKAGSKKNTPQQRKKQEK
ncbi:MAG: hypothetical protein ACREBQ_11255 [Nitrososphaerales archaeon]